MSPYGCVDTYPGSEPNSEPESQNLISYFQTISPMPEMAVCFHSAAELWLYPYGYALNTYQDNVDEVVRMLKGSTRALKNSEIRHNGILELFFRFSCR